MYPHLIPTCIGVVLALCVALYFKRQERMAAKQRDARQAAKTSAAQTEEAARSAEVESRMRARFERETRGYVHHGEAILPAALVADAGGVDAGACDGGSACSVSD